MPAAGRARFTSLYDPAMASTMREATWRPRVIESVLTHSEAPTVLDIGSGTGTMLIDLVRECPKVRPIGVDGDSQVISRATIKAAAAGVKLDLRLGRAQALPLADSSVDVVTMSLLLHHLTDADKLAALREALRVLRAGGKLFIVDWGRPHSVLFRALFLLVQALDGAETTRANVNGKVPGIAESAGFREICLLDRWRTIWGSLELIAAVR